MSKIIGRSLVSTPKDPVFSPAPYTMLHPEVIEAVELYGIPRDEISVERLLTELKSKAVGFRLNDYDDENWEAGFYLGEDWANIYNPDILRLLALSYCAICAHEFHEAVNRANLKKTHK
jgi:hypothetical protein